MVEVIVLRFLARFALYLAIQQCVTLIFAFTTNGGSASVDGLEIHCLTGHEDSVTSIDFNHSGDLLIATGKKSANDSDFFFILFF